MSDGVWARLRLIVAKGESKRVGADKVQARVLDGETLPNIERVEPYGYSYRPKSGSQAYVLFPSGDRSFGMAIVIGDKQYQMQLQEGEVAIHDDQNQSVHLTRTGIVVNGGGFPVTITSTPKVRIEADLDVTGDIKDRCDAADGRTMERMREVYADHDHDHGDPAGTTSKPNQEV